MPTPDGAPLLRLLQIVSPALPIGAYNFSQGLEWAVERQWVHDETSLARWCRGLLDDAFASLDLPLLLRIRTALDAGDAAAARTFSARLLAARETQELRAEERHLARALAKALIELEVPGARDWLASPAATQAALFALASADARVPPAAMAQAYAWAWCENQVLAALKLMSLGQSAGLRIGRALQGAIPSVVERAMACEDDAIGTAAPRAAMASAWHETQYSRLFRS